MAFEDLWEKYGEQKSETPELREREQPSKQSWNEYEQTMGVGKDDAASDKSQAFCHEKNTAAPDKTDYVPAPPTKLSGVFGDSQDVPAGTKIRPVGKGKAASKRIMDLRSSSRQQWPWLDIVFILITVVMVVGVLVNFESVTTAVFLVLLSLIQSLFQLIVVISLIAVAIWWITRRPRRRW